MSLEKISIDDIKVGMHIQRFNMSWFTHPFLTNSFTIKNKKDLDKIAKLKPKIEYLYIDPEKGFYDFSENSQDSQQDLSQQYDLKPLSQGELNKLEDPVPLSEELKTSRKIYAKTQKVIKNIFHKAENGEKIDWTSVLETTDNMTKSVLRNKDAFSNLIMIQHHDNYTFYHSMNVCCLCLTMGRYLSLPEVDLATLGVGALLHDIGKVRIPKEIINKPGKLTDQEYSVIKNHPKWSLEILSEYSACSPLNWDSINLTYEHHERFDGSGYPLGIKGDRINQFALIAAIADVFDAITTDRPYRKALSPFTALKIMFEANGKDFSPEYLSKFTHCMGIYPVSSVIELDNGEIGVVTEINHQAFGRPKMVVVSDLDHGKLKKPKPVDLSSDEYSRIVVKRAIDANKIGIDTNAYLV